VRLSAVDARAHGLGLHPGQTLAEARAMQPALLVEPHDTAADAALLAALADWADRYTPLVGRTPPDGLLLDLTGAAHLFGGEAALQRDLAARLARQGFAVRTAVAETAGGAFALARTAPTAHTVVPDGHLPTALAPLPVAGLRLPADTVAALRRLGLKTIGALAERPRAPLAARFGPLLLRRLDQAFGRDAEAIDPRQPVPPARVDLPLAEPILHEADVVEAARLLLGRLCALLEARGEGARALVLTLFRVDGHRREVAVGAAAPTRDAIRLEQLLALRLGHLADPIEAGYGFDHVSLAASATGPCAARAVDLPSLAAAAPLDAARAASLAERLAARFGLGRVLAFRAADTHLPERASHLAPWRPEAPARVSIADPAAPAPVRPIRLFEPPEPVEIIAEVPDGPPLRLRWRRRSLRIVAAEGPERIAPEWWRLAEPAEPDAGIPAALDPRVIAHRTRDYYCVADETGRRLWIFREGLYAGAAVPRWFVHGLVA
jgi:protein ImuB